MPDASPSSTSLPTRQGRVAVRSAGPSGGPGVLLLTGAGVPARSWYAPLSAEQRAPFTHTPPAPDRPPLEALLTSFARVVSYDRAGQGESEPPTSPRDLDSLLEELAAVHAASLPGPAVLVGHSVGGPLAFEYARRWPQRVAGLVLLDPSHPDQWSRFLDGASPDEAAGRTAEAAFLRDEHPERLDLTSVLARGAHQLPVGALGDLPLAVVAGCVRPDLERGRSLYPDMTAERWRNVWALFAALQREYLPASTASRLVMAEHSGHYPQLDQPQLIADTVRAVWQAAQAPAC